MEQEQNRRFLKEIKTQNQNYILELRVKSHTNFENYLDSLSDFHVRKAVSRFRISAHRFPIERGRFHNIPRKQRLCPICKTNEVGDEFHYFYKCHHPRLKIERKTFLEKLASINQAFSLFDEKNLFYYILSMNDITTIKC